eukprot:2445412-Pyramimonas_sp.AAC.2
MHTPPQRPIPPVTLTVTFTVTFTVAWCERLADDDREHPRGAQLQVARFRRARREVELRRRDGVAGDSNIGGEGVV